MIKRKHKKAQGLTYNIQKDGIQHIRSWHIIHRRKKIKNRYLKPKQIEDYRLYEASKIYKTEGMKYAGSIP